MKPLSAAWKEESVGGQGVEGRGEKEIAQKRRELGRKPENTEKRWGPIRFLCLGHILTCEENGNAHKPSLLIST